MSIQSYESYNSITLIPTASVHYSHSEGRLSNISIDFLFLKWGVTIDIK